VGDGVTLSDKFINSFLDSHLGDLIIEVEAHNGRVASGGGGAREGEHESFGDVVEFTVGFEGNGLPFIRSLNPVSHVVDGGVTCGGSR